jgi:hypothetical protein
MENDLATCGGNAPGFASRVAGSDAPRTRVPACAEPSSGTAGLMRRPPCAGPRALPEV